MSNCQKKAIVTKHPPRALKISAKVRYALRILKDIAEHQNDTVAPTEAVISRRQAISEKFLSRIVLPLRDSGLVGAHRGSRDGFSLLKKPDKITLLDIIESVQGPIEILECLNPEIDCGRKRNCFARRIWARVNADLRKSLASITLADALER